MNGILIMYTQNFLMGPINLFNISIIYKLIDDLKFKLFKPILQI